MTELIPPRRVFSIQTNCLAVVFNIADQKKQQRIKELFKNNNLPKVKTGYFKFYEMEALFKLQLFEEFRNGFGYWEAMLNRGAGTWWEYFDPEAAEIPEVSLCHGWWASPLTLLAGRLLGIIPVRPGFQEFLVKPAIGDLEWLECSVPTVRGDIVIKYRRQGKQRELTCTIPKVLSGPYSDPGADNRGCPIG